MANFTRAKPASWTENNPLTHDQMNHIDEVLPKLINASEGSTHSPSDQIRIEGGEGLYVETFAAGPVAELTIEDLTVEVERGLVIVPTPGNQTLEGGSLYRGNSLGPGQTVQWTLAAGTAGQRATVCFNPGSSGEVQLFRNPGAQSLGNYTANGNHMIFLVHVNDVWTVLGAITP